MRSLLAIALLAAACGGTTDAYDAGAGAGSLAPGPRTSSGVLTPSGGTITAVTPTAGGGLTGGGTHGSVTLGLLTSCAANQVLFWSGSVWACADPATLSTTLSGSLTAGTVPVATGAHGLQNGSLSDTGSAVSTSSTVTVNNALTMQDFAMLPEQAPAALAPGNNNDYTPTNWANYAHWHLTPASGGSTITGMGSLSTDRWRLIMNVSNTDSLTFTNDDTNSSVGNRIYLGNNTQLVIGPRLSALFHYESGDGHWHVVANAGSVSLNGILTSGYVPVAAGPSSIVNSNTVFVNNSTGSVGIGTNGPQTLLDIVATANSLDALQLRKYFSGVSGGKMFVTKASGTVGTPTAVNAGDNVFTLSAYGYDGAAYQASSQISHQVDPNGTVSSGNVPGMITMSTGSNVGNLTSGLSIDSVQRATVQRINIGPANFLSRIGWQGGQAAILNNWNPTGLGTGEPIVAQASDNQGTLVTGICTSPSVSGCSGMTTAFKKNDILELCNASAPQDDGILALSNEDQRSQDANRIILPNTGVPGQGNSYELPIPQMSCATLVLREWDPVNFPGNLKWMLHSISSERQSKHVEQFRGIFPDSDYTNLHGSYNDVQLGNATAALPGQLGYATTVAAGSNNQTTPGGSTTFTLNVASASAFLAPGGFAPSPSHPVYFTVNAHTGGWTGFKCTGATATTFTGCIGGVVTFLTGDVVQGGLCDGATTCGSDDYETMVISGVSGDTSTVTFTGLHWAGNAAPDGLGPVKIIYNAGPGPLTLSNNSSSSAVGNRFSFSTGADVTLQVGQSITLYHPGVYLGAWITTNTVLPYSGSETIAISSANAISQNTQSCTFNLVTGNNNDINPTCTEGGAVTFANTIEQRFVGASGSVLTGMTAGNVGDLKKLCNYGAATQIKDTSASSSSANRLKLANSENVLLANQGCITFRYDNNLYWEEQSVMPAFQTTARFTGDGTVTSPLELNISSGTCAAGTATTSLTATGGVSCSTFFNTAGTNLSASGSTVSLSSTPTISGNSSLLTTQNWDIGPGILLSGGTALTSGSTTNNWDPTGTGAGAGNATPLYTWIRSETTNTGTAIVSGMVGPGAGTHPGLRSTICNFGTGAIEFQNQSSSSAAGNRFFLPYSLSTNPTVALTSYGGCIEFVYDNNGYWMPMGPSSMPEHPTNVGPIPTLSSCGGGSPTIVGTDAAGTVTEGTSATGCTVTFAVAYDTFADVPTCTVSPMNVNPATFTYTVSRTAITVTNTSASGDIFAYHCIQTKN